MRIDDADRYCLLRRGRYLAAELKRPHRVRSTCPVNGGLREELTHIANHHGSEGIANVVRDYQLLALGLDAYHRKACAAGALPPGSTVLMATAANMQCAVLARAGHADLEVAVAATAGVLANATGAGDPAGWHEHPEGCRPLARATRDIQRREGAMRRSPPKRGPAPSSPWSS